MNRLPHRLPRRLPFTPKGVVNGERLHPLNDIERKMNDR